MNAQINECAVKDKELSVIWLKTEIKRVYLVVTAYFYLENNMSPSKRIKKIEKFIFTP